MTARTAGSRLVCFHSVATHLGGGERSLLELVTGLQARPELGFAPWVLLPKPDGPLVDRLRAASVPHEVLELPEALLRASRQAPLTSLAGAALRAPGAAAYIARLIRLLRERRPAVLHTNGLKCHAASAIAGPAARVPLVLWHLRDIVATGSALTGLRALFRLSGAHAVANSRATAEAFLAHDPRVEVNHNGLDPLVYAPRPNRDFHDRLRIPRETPLVGIVGVLARWKGQLEFLKMARKIVEAGSPARFAVIGGEIYDTGADRGFGQELRSEAERLGIADRVLFTGYFEDAPRAVNALDVLVHASVRPEPFGRVIVEAMACGVPVVATNAGGVPEIAIDGESALLVPPGNVDAMAAAVARLVGDPGLRASIAERGRDEFLARFTRERHVERMAKIYSRLLGGSVAGGGGETAG